MRAHTYSLKTFLAALLIGVLAGCATTGDEASAERLEVLLENKLHHLATLEREKAQIEAEIRALEEAIRVVRGR
jgi:peptidoglycan hydrolase CwlO-like protein